MNLYHQVTQFIDETELTREGVVYLLQLLIKLKIHSKLILNHAFAEIITIELCLSPRSLYLSCVYIAPNCSDANHQHLFNHFNAQVMTFCL